MTCTVNQVIFSVHHPTYEFLSVPAHVGTAGYKDLAKLIDKSLVYPSRLVRPGD
jgi:hypothetical protein